MNTTKAASHLGQKGGRSKSARKVEAARENMRRINERKAKERAESAEQADDATPRAAGIVARLKQAFPWESGS